MSANQQDPFQQVVAEISTVYLVYCRTTNLEFKLLLRRQIMELFLSAINILDEQFGFGDNVDSDTLSFDETEYSTTDDDNGDIDEEKMPQ